MSFAIQLDQKQSLISAKLMGEFTPDLAIEFFQELMHKVQVTQVERIFTDVTEVAVSSPLEHFEQVPDELLQMGFPRELKRAILVSGETESFKKWESLLFSKGFDRVKLFEGEDKAREWLMT